MSFGCFKIDPSTPEGSRSPIRTNLIPLKIKVCQDQCFKEFVEMSFLLDSMLLSMTRISIEIDEQTIS